MTNETTLRLKLTQADWSSGSVPTTLLETGVWKRASHLYQLVVIDETIKAPDGALNVYPFVYNNQDDLFPIDPSQVPAYLDILKVNVGGFLSLPDMELAKKGTYTRAFQVALVTLAWRTALLPDPQRYAGAMTLVLYILQLANPGTTGMVVTMFNRNNALYPIVVTV